MASSWASKAARQAAIVSRLSSPTSSAQAVTLVQRRGLAGAADHHGPPRVNFWQDPMSPSKWKEEHPKVLKSGCGRCNGGGGAVAVAVCKDRSVTVAFVIVSLSGWGLLFFGGYKLFSGGKKDEEELKCFRQHKLLVYSLIAIAPFYLAKSPI
ncbi:hypothetical protein TEA_005989 [Camellia sinensis var. sinensis]|uniref:Uncharacterized protein n=1 Tax=Camellia sinensis var. sinensis TaxID=542762 RepID=A0A4S4D7T7_CAMSN|nr:hypothetical protein TEA_005989 [Camellia sinensis var. sinensis]